MRGFTARRDILLLALAALLAAPLAGAQATSRTSAGTTCGTWASWHVMADTTIAELQELSAWKSDQMVKRYAHFARE